MAPIKHTIALQLLAVAALLCTPTSTAAYQPRKLLETQSVQAAQSANGVDNWVTEAWQYVTGGGSSSSSNPGPCIPCRDCSTNHCYSICQKSCNIPTPPQPIVNGNTCKAYGAAAGAQVANDACSTTMLYCNGGQKNLVGSYFPVTLSQCANIAFGVCQKQATTSSSVSCSKYWALGYQRCTASQFWQFYQGEVNDRCNQKVANIK